MELPEKLETLNYRLVKFYGKLTDDKPIWRIVWSEDQFEKRRGTFHYTDASGNFLKAETGVQTVRKYSYIKEKYILERIVHVPSVNREELLTEWSYEPIFVFEDKDGNALPPIWDVCKIVIDKILEMTGRTGEAKYRDPESTTEEHLEARKKRIEKLQEEMFGNETELGDSLAYKEAIIVPGAKQ